MGPTGWADATHYPYISWGIQVRHNGVIYTSKVDHISSPISEPGVGAESSTYWSLYSIFNVTNILDNFASEYPEYEDQGFKIVGYGWWQGHKDGGEVGTGTAGIHATRYEFNMVNFINDIRAYYEDRYPANTIADAPFVVATVGFGGGAWDIGSSADVIHTAQMAVGDPVQHPEFSGNVASVDTTGYWRDSSISPTTAGYHYNGNAETFMLVGDAMGRAMAEMQAPYSVNAGDNMITWSGEPVELDATVQEDITVTSYLWSADPDTGVVFSDPAIEDPTVTITKATTNPSVVTLTLEVDDSVNPLVTDRMRIDVYDTACLATIGIGLTEDHPTDLVGDDCITDIEDFAEMAAKWLNDTGLPEPIAK